MEVLDLLAVFVANDFADLAVIVSLALLGIPHQLVKEIAEVQYEAQSIVLGCTFILEDHSPISIHRPKICILATDESEAYWTDIIIRWGRDSSYYAASVAFRIRKAIPIDMRRFQPSHQYTAGPVCSFGDRYDFGCDDLSKRFVLS